jgi:glycerate dehydrogenase
MNDDETKLNQNKPHGDGMQGVLTETTAELAASLSLAAARRIVEADQFMRAGLYEGWLPHLSVSSIASHHYIYIC